MKIKTVIYLHGNKDMVTEAYVDACMEHNIPAEQIAIGVAEAAYACYEVGIEVEFDTDTGDSKLLRIVE